jgi:transcriptional regulator with XRE-family HTH domain
MDHLIEELYKQIGNNIYKIRKGKKLSAEELGNRIGVTKKTIRRYELGEIKISYDRLTQLASSLSVEASQLYPVNKQSINLEQLIEFELSYKGQPLSREKKQQIVDVLAKILDFKL